MKTIEPVLEEPSSHKSGASCSGTVILSLLVPNKKKVVCLVQRTGARVAFAWYLEQALSSKILWSSCIII